jgi:peptidoglycan hydrolase FlgJ
MPAIPARPMNAAPQSLAIDTRGLDALKGRMAGDPKGTAKEVARQFEALFMNELLKSMRSTTLSTGALDNEGSKMGTDMLDAQFAQKLTGLPGGLSDAIARQLERQMGLNPGPIPRNESANRTPVPLERVGKPVQIPQTGAAGFVQQHTEAARAAEQATGIPAAFMISQAALETGWGRKEIRHADGASAHNLFGIKAGPNWKGAVAEVMTTEYINGKPQKVMAKFRAYSSYAESFADYARLMKNSPRYEQVLAKAETATGFAQGLQRAGYATDPAYAEKLSRVINTTLRLQRSLA